MSNEERAIKQRQAPWQSFGLLCSHWRGLGVWLSLWTAEGRCLDLDDSIGGPFKVLWQHSPRFREWLAGLARSADQGQSHPALVRAELGGLVGFAVPVTTNETPEHIVVAVLVPQGYKANAEIAVLCAQSELDTAIVAQLAEDVAWHDLRSVASMQDLLGLLVEQIHRNPQDEESIQNLAANLAQTYEVLNLIYHVGDKFDGRQKPDEFFERTFAEVIAVLQVESLAAVTHISAREGEPAVIVVGKGQAHRQQITAVAEGLSSVMLDRKMLMLNRAMIRRFLPDQDWLSNLVAVWLLRQGEPVGALLAINKADGKDFDDIDLQMLQVLADRSSIYLEDLHILGDLQELLIALLRSLVNSIDAMDPYTSGHGERVALVARRVAERMGCDPGFCQRAYFGGLLHDIGKIAIPGSLLRKPSRLSEEELEMIRQHPVSGARIIERIEAVRDIAPAVLGHHERIDGKGYPNGIAGDQIPLLARIVAVADCFDAMTSQRAYRPAKPMEQVKSELRSIAGTHLDAAAVEALLGLDLEALHKELATYHSGLRTSAHHLETVSV